MINQKRKKWARYRNQQERFWPEFPLRKNSEVNRILLGISVKLRLQQITYINFINNWPKILVY